MSQQSNCNMTKTGREKEAVLSVFAALVQPLMRVAFEYGISAGEIAGVVRRVYIQALEARLREQKRPTTDARLAVVAHPLGGIADASVLLATGDACGAGCGKPVDIPSSRLSRAVASAQRRYSHT